MTPLTAVFIFFARNILQLWLGDQFAAQSAVVMQLVALLFFLNAFAYIPYSSVQALGRPDLKAILDLLMLPTYAVTCWWLTHHMGINGSALAKLAVTTLDCSFLYVFAWKMKAFRLGDLVSGPLFRAGVAAGGLFLAVWLIHSLHVSLVMSVLFLLLSFAGFGGGSGRWRLMRKTGPSRCRCGRGWLGL